MSEIERLSAAQTKAIAALLSEPTTRAAARAAKVSEATIFRWLAEPAFSAAYRNARLSALETTIADLQRIGGAAVKALHRVLTDKLAKPGEVVSAARAILEYSLRGHDALDVLQKVRELEGRLDGNGSNTIKAA